jgi:hypothetical protein
MDLSKELKAEEILKAEWDYIKGTAAEAQEDRARVSTFFLGSAASLVAVILGSKSNELTSAMYFGFGVLLIVMGFAGWLTLGHLIRLRAAWYESILSLNLIKEYYFITFKDTNLKAAFNWRVDRGLRLYKPLSVSFLFALQVALMTVILFSAAIYCFYQAKECLNTNYFIVVAAGVVMGILQMCVYRCMLKKEEVKLLNNYRKMKAKITK